MEDVLEFWQLITLMPILIAGDIMVIVMVCEKATLFIFYRYIMSPTRYESWNPYILSTFLNIL